MVNRDTVFNELRQRGFFEMYEVSTFKGYRNTADGGVQALTVEVWDRGPNSGGERYAVMVTDATGRIETGNPQDDLADALRLVHWRNLDRDPS